MCELTNTDDIDLSKYYDNPEDYILLTDEFFDSLSNRPQWADFLRGARNEAEFTRREAAISLGITPKELKAIEKGLIKPSKEFLLKMRKTYNYNIPLSSLLVDYVD